MSILEEFLEKSKKFKPTNWAVKNRTTVYLLILMVSLFGVYKFVATPKESFPDVVIPNVYISTIYVGNSPKDIENLVTQPIEKQLKGMTGVKVTKVTSSSFQDYSSIMVEFGSDEKVEVALQKVKDAIDKARQDLPTDLTQEPTALEVSMSEMPIMYVNLSGDIDRVRLKEYADKMKDRIEELSQITRVDLVGAPEREFQINVDNAKMQAAGVTFDDIATAVKYENADISGGLLEVGNMRRNLQLKGQFKTARDIEEVIVRNNTGNPIYLKNIASIKDTIKETDSYARLDGKTVLTLNIVKRSGENLIETSDAVKAISEDMKKTVFPQNLSVTITGDQSISTRTSFNDLVNSIVIGFILVLIILMFFMGLTNAFFVALSVPLSMFVAFMFIPVGEAFIGTNITLNFMVLFALLFGLGIIVDDAIVVIENTHRIFTEGKGKINPQRASMLAAGEVFVPVLAGTLTTLAPFVPLLFWPGIIGKFMIYLPLMLIFTLAASLFVAFLMNPVFAVDFMNHPDNPEHKKKSDVFRSRPFVVMIVIGVLFDLMGIPMGKGSIAFFIGNLSLFMALLTVLYTYFFDDWIHKFQNKALPWIMGHYEDLLKWALKGWRPVWLLLGAFGLLVVSFMMFSASAGAGRTKIVFFPSSDPNFIYVYLKLPSGTDVKYTDSITRSLEAKVNQALDIDPAKGKKNAVVESVIANVAVGAADPNSGDRSTRSNLGRIQVSFVEFEKRHGVSTAPYLTKVRQAIRNIPGAEISVEQEKNGPPTDPPINIEVASEEFDNLIPTAVSLKNYLDSLQIPGVEELKMDVDLSSPEVTLKVNRERALSEGVSSGQIGQQIRTALFGNEASKIKNGKDEYKIYVRNNELQRKNLTDLLNMNVVFREATGKIKSVPIISLVDVDYTNTLGSVQRKNQKRMITLRSNVLEAEGYTPTGVNAQIKSAIDNFHATGDDVTIKQTGEGEQQAETGAFLGRALMIALGLILLILVAQFNSMSKSVIILTEIVFSVIGVLLGFTLTGMAVSVVMTGVGILGLAGIVIKNGILVIEFADELRGRGLKTREAVIQAGKTRIIPVLLTALAAIMALIPLAVGFNINFVTMFSELNPKIFFGGDNVMFWKPLSWTIIFGLAFAFFMTLVMVPSMYLIAERLKRPMRNTFGGKWISFLGIPPAIFLFIPLMLFTMFRQRRKVARRRNRLAGQKNTVNEAYIGSWF
ncbi:efflux RND transporter permease subunit [Niabella sp.]|uniref:efflux RND transporter permease subunit n=1 Tax=Niabella sp. TaxID=1962976 RepID=UPI00260BC1D2|nr:efflux RND transporter permease subunit [Niabella sp.]